MKYGKINKPIFKRQDKRGDFLEVVNYGQWESLIVGKMKKGAEMGHHYHKYTKVFFYLIKGETEVRTLNLKSKKINKATLFSNMGYLFKPEEVRIIKYKKASRFLMLKSHVYDPQNPDLIDCQEKF